MLRTTQNKVYRQGIKDPKELEDGFPAKPEELFAYQGLIIGGVEASYFTAAQQQAIRDFVDRRGGGLLFIGGRASLSDGGWQNSPMADLVPVRLPEGRGTFHRDFSSVALTAQGAQSILCRLDENRRAQCRAVEEDSADRQLSGCRRGQAGRHYADGSAAGGQAAPAPARDRELRPRAHRAVRHRRKLALEDVARPCRQNSRHFLAADVPPPGERHSGAGGRFDAQIRIERRHQAAAPRGSPRQAVQAGDQRQSAGAFPRARWHQRHHGTFPRSAGRRNIRRRMDRGETGLVRGGNSGRAGDRTAWPRRADFPPRGRGGRELPHVAEQGTAHQVERADRRAVLQAG